MQKRPIELYLQRGRLTERIAAQRATLARELAPVRIACDSTDRALAAVRNTIGFLRQHPAAVAVLVAAFIALKPHRAWRWLRQGRVAWRSWNVLRGLLPHSR
jgi:hypothetical protein